MLRSIAVLSLLVRSAVYPSQRGNAKGSRRILIGQSGSVTCATFSSAQISREALAPSEAPAIQTGALVNSIAQGLTFSSATTAILSSQMEYAEFLEEGTDRVAARPYAGPAIKSVMDLLNGAGVLHILS